MQKFGESAKRGNFSEWCFALKKEKIREAYFIHSKSIAEDKNFIEFNGTSILSSESFPETFLREVERNYFFFLFYFSSSLHFRIFSTNLFFFSKTFKFPLRDFSLFVKISHHLLSFSLCIYVFNNVRNFLVLCEFRSLWRYPKFSFIAYNF